MPRPRRKKISGGKLANPTGVAAARRSGRFPYYQSLTSILDCTSFRETP